MYYYIVLINQESYIFNRRTKLRSFCMARKFSSKYLAKKYFLESDFRDMDYEVIKVRNEAVTDPDYEPL